MRERRRAQRLHLPGKVSLDLGGQHFEFPAADISVSGVGILMDIAVLGTKPSGQVGHCRIESPVLSEPIEAFVSVMRIRHVGQQFLVGLRFESIDDDKLALIERYQSL